MIRNTITILIFSILMSAGGPDTRIIKGKITFEGKPAIGASVFAVGTTIGTVVRAPDGTFTLKMPNIEATLKISFIGFKTERIVVPPDSSYIEINLTKSVTETDEVLVLADVESVAGEGIESMVAITSGYASGSEGRSAKSPRIHGHKILTEKMDYSSVSTIAYDGPEVAPGILTAGEIHDFSKWELWNDIAEVQLEKWQKAWEINPVKRYSVQVETHNAFPVINANVMLRNDEGEILWQARTDNTGKAELWVDIFPGDKETGNVSIEVLYNNEVYNIDDAKEFHNGINFLKVEGDCGFSDKVDIAFIVDATGSMQDEINYLKAELNDIIAKVKDLLPEIELNLGSIFYRDKVDAYLTKKSDLSSDINQTVEFIKTNNADGGGDYPEAVEQGLDSALNSLSWRENTLTKIAFLILDAPPHSDQEVKNKLKEITKKYAEKGIRIIPVGCSGIDKSTEYLMRSLALATNGTYVFLTDHSGVGNPHIEPTTNKYDVELLNDVLQRLIVQFTFKPECSVFGPPAAADTLVVTNDNLNNDSTGTETNEDLLSSWKYYPNPTSGVINMDFDGNAIQMFITDISGKIIEKLDINGLKNYRFDLSNYPNGVYFIKYEAAPDKWLSGKILLIR